MSAWQPQRYRKIGRAQGRDEEVLTNAIAIARKTVAVDRELEPVFTLRHLSYLSGVDYGFLRAVVTRNLRDPYRIFRIAKSRKQGKQQNFRVICVPDPPLMRVQRWISRRILSRGKPHEASFAYLEHGGIKKAAELHCGCRWMIKLDVRRFFESISEIGVYGVFLDLGYQPLVAFELARLCTRLGSLTPSRRHDRWFAEPFRRSAIVPYYQQRIGHLPQGAPTSPMVSNLAVRRLDEDVADIAEENGLTYTRYADDLCLSTMDDNFGRKRAGRVIGLISRRMTRVGLSPNLSKIRIVPPGGRKVVLGLLVDGPSARLSREFRARMRQHLYYLTDPRFGPVRHAEQRGFVSVLGLRNHVEGLIAFAKDIEVPFALKCEQLLSRVDWPL